MMDRRPSNKAAPQHRNKSLYSTKEWQRIRARQLRIEPHCRMCAAVGIKTQATICDHVERHGYDPVRFFAGPFASLCKTHHDSEKQKQERRGYSDALGNDGVPSDPNHPFNKG